MGSATYEELELIVNIYSLSTAFRWPSVIIILIHDEKII